MDVTTKHCPFQGSNCHRRRCQPCNASYMKHYQRRRRSRMPEVALLERARRRCRDGGVRFALKRSDIYVPPICPALGIVIEIGMGRTDHSPSLDRIRPNDGYINDNIRVLSDRANRLKGDRTLTEIHRLAEHGRRSLRADYAKIAQYMEREALLVEVRQRAASGGRMGQEWAKIAAFLDRAFSGKSTTP